VFLVIGGGIAVRLLENIDRSSSQDGVPVGMTFFTGSVMLLAGAGDVRMLLCGGVLGAKPSRDISGACALGCSSQQGLFSWDPRTAH
jgi:hypothetical protein